MKKNPNKKAGEWGALNNKPINQIYFKDGGTLDAIHNFHKKKKK
jgi:hypothetical protein